MVSRHTPAPVDHHFPYLKHGTRITVRDLFGNMPVRVKQRAIEAEKHNGNAKSWDELKRGVVGLLLSWPDHVALTIRDVESGQKIVIRPSIANQLPGSLSAREIDMQNIHSILFQARYVNNTERGSWVAVAASTSNLNITGAISLRPSPSRKVQFLSIGIEPLTSFHSQDVLYDEINRLFLESSFGDEEANLRAVDLRQGRRTEEYCEQPKYTKRELRSNRKGVDRWPMFYLKIDVLGNPRNREKPKIDSVLDDGGAAVENILELLRATISEFLSKHHFQSRSFAKEPVLVSVETSADRRAEESCDTFSATYKGLKSKATANEQLSTDNLNISPTKGPFDSLKGNVQLPSLSQGAKSHSPFDAWSRVKSGSPVWKDLVETTESGSARSRTLRVSSAHDREIVPSKPEAGTSNPLICKSGKVLRPPFDNSQLQNELVSLRKPDDNDHTDAQGDEIESWLDPVSKLESMVNRRTGCTISSKEKRTGSGPFSRNKAGVINPSNRPQSTMPYPKRPSSPWINDILNAWENPTFVPSRSQATDDWKRIPNLTTQSVREAGCTKYSDVDIEQAFQQSASAIQGRISKESLLSAEVVAQVDDKFILLKMQPTDPEADLATVARDPILVIVDQHAADERVRIEELMAELCAQRYDKEIGIVRMILDRPLIFEIAPNEVEMLRSQRQHFADWGIQYDIQCGQSVDEEEQDTRLIVRSLPPCVMERYALDPALLINHIRSEVWKKNQERIGSAALGRTRTALSEVEPRHTWVRLIHDCPQGLMDVLNSRSCRSRSSELSIQLDSLTISRCYYVQ